MEQLANNSTTTLNGGINNSVTSITVTDGSVFPSSGNFRLICESEIMLCSARSSNTLTVTRGSEGTTGASHADGTSISHILTAASVRQLFADYLASGTYSGRPTAGLAGRQYTYDDAPWFTKAIDSGSAWFNYWGGLKLETPLSTGWTTGAGTATFPKDTILLTDAGATTQIYRTVTAPYDISMAIWNNIKCNGGSSAYFGARQSSDGKVKACQWFKDQNEHKFAIIEFNTFPSSVSSVVIANRSAMDVAPLFCRLVDDNTNLKFYLSVDGIDWQELHSESRTDFITGNQLILGNDSGSQLIISHLDL